MIKLRFFGSTLTQRRWTLAVLLLLFGIGFARYFHMPGDDLSVSYLGCRLIAAGDTQHLYSYDPDTFSDVAPDDTAWQDQADATGFTGFIHPYVQTPLWAWSLQPLCKRVSFPAFCTIFSGLTVLSFLALTWLVARFWTPDLLNPLAISVLLLLFSRSEPFRYAMILMQTHVLYLLLTVASLMLAQRRRPVAAGLLLALAAAVKITPGFLLIYWLLTRRFRAAISMVGFSALLLLAAIFATGRPLFATFLADLHRISNVLLVSGNNQSFAAWRMGSSFPLSQLDDLIAHDLPSALRLGSNLLVLLSVVAGGLMDRRSSAGMPVIARTPGLIAPPPLGAIFAIVGITLFTPIAWTHYYIVLLPAVMLLLQEFHTAALRSSRRSQVWLLALTLLVALLNFRPVAGDAVHQTPGLLGIVRSHFYSGALCLVTLALAAWNRRRLDAIRGSVQTSPEGLATPLAAETS